MITDNEIKIDKTKMYALTWIGDRGAIYSRSLRDRVIIDGPNYTVYIKNASDKTYKKEPGPYNWIDGGWGPNPLYWDIKILNNETELFMEFLK